MSTVAGALLFEIFGAITAHIKAAQQSLTVTQCKDIWSVLVGKGERTSGSYFRFESILPRSFLIGY